MYKRELVVLAETLRKYKPTKDDSLAVWESWEHMCNSIADTCAVLTHDPKVKKSLFDRSKFLEVCGL